MKISQSSFLLGSLLFSICVGTSFCQSTPCGKQVLPAQAVNLIQARFPGYHIVTLNDLDMDERADWLKSKLDQCPGIVEGKFGPSIKGYAVSLKKDIGGFRSSAVLVFLQHMPKQYTIRILMPPTAITAHTYVLSIAPPGRYHEVESNNTVRTRWPMIVYEAIGAGATGYFYAGKTWRNILLTE